LVAIYKSVRLHTHEDSGVAQYRVYGGNIPYQAVVLERSGLSMDVAAL
jgi:allantoicase